MTGREEMDYKNELWIKNKLKDCPNILRDYIDNLGDSKTSWSKRNYLGYLIQFINYLKENGYNPDDNYIYGNIKPLDINKYLNYIGYRYVNGNKVKNKAGIKAAKLFAVSDFFKFLMENDIINNNPCEKVKVPKDEIEKNVVALTQDEIKVVQNNIINRGKGRCKKYSSRDLCIFTLGVTTGLRVSAIVGINISDIDFEQNRITVTEKRKKTYDVFIGEKTKGIIQDWISEREKLLIGYPPTDALFISKDKRRMSTVSIRKMLNKDTTGIDKHITPHKLRSTCGVNLYEATGDVYLVKDQLHHSNIETTKIYVEASESRKRMATETLDCMI